MPVPVNIIFLFVLRPQKLRDVLKIMIHIFCHLDIFRRPVNFQNPAALVSMLVVPERPDGLYEKIFAKYRADCGLRWVSLSYFTDLLMNVIPFRLSIQERQVMS